MNVGVTKSMNSNEVKMKSKEKQFTVRVSQDLHGKASKKANLMNVSLAELMRISLTSFCTQLKSDDTNSTKKLLHSQLRSGNGITHQIRHHNNATE